MSFVYRGLKATLNRHMVTDAEIDRQLERLQQQCPRIAGITDRPTQAGEADSGAGQRHIHPRFRGAAAG